jgi:putative DNA methylase
MYKKKLIETSIPLDEINAQAVREKSIRKGHPSTLHLWWARRPLAAARCVIFASMVDDPAEHPELFPTEEDQKRERDRLFEIIRQLANWDNIGDERLYQRANDEMKKYAPNGKLPEFLDPFAGGGALPLEAQRLGLVSHAADLNPIPVTLNRAMIDIPARFCGQDPVNPEARRQGLKGTYPRATGLAADVEYYANVMRERAKERIGANYPDVEVTKGNVTKKATPIAYVWARTVTCPNPACRHETPLVRSFWLSKKKGHRAYIEPVAEGGKMRYEVHCEGDGKPADFAHVHEGTVGRRGAVCLHCGAPISLDYVRAESRDHGLGNQLMAIVSESPFGQGRWYSSATKPDEADADVPEPKGVPTQKLPAKALGFRIQAYGFTYWKDLYTNRQLTALVTMSDLVSEMRSDIKADAISAGLSDDEAGLDGDGRGAKAYAQAVSTYLAFMIDKEADYCSSICTWHTTGEKMRNVFARQAIPMAWDYAEVNPLSSSSGSLSSMVSQVSEAVKALPSRPQCDVTQRNAAQTEGLSGLLISTDPPYYDNIDYSDLSDFFYVWAKRSLKDVWPDTFGFLLTPKREELIATPYRFDGGAQEAKTFFENGMRETFTRLAGAMSSEYPMTVYYAYKQTEMDNDSRTSSGWETMLQALMDSGLQITGTWPVRTELGNRTRGIDSNALASSVVLACRRRPEDAPIASRPEFLRALRRNLRDGLADMQSGSIAPVDLAQAAIGPGMAAFSRYSEVLEADGRPMSVHTALGIINEQLDALIGESGEDLDGETRFCLTWYAEHGFEEGPFGDAQVLQNARGASLEALSHAGVLASGGGKVRLVRPTEVADITQARLAPSCWSDLMAEVGALESREGVGAAAMVASEFDDARAERTKSLAYLLFQSAERAGRGEDAQLFNDLVTSWGDITERAEGLRRHRPVQGRLDLGFGTADA